MSKVEENAKFGEEESFTSSALQSPENLH